MRMTQQQFSTLLESGLSPRDRALAGFAEACYDNNSVDELRGFASATPDADDMAAWGIDADEWRQAQREALEAAMAEFEREHGSIFGQS